MCISVGFLQMSFNDSQPFFSLAIRCIPYFMEVASTFDTKIKRHWAEKIKTSVQIFGK